MKNWKIVLVVLIFLSMAGLLVTYSVERVKNSALNSKSSEDGLVAGATTEKSGSYVERLAKSLNDNGAVLYGQADCRDCKVQKDLFGDSAKYLDYVDCDSANQNANPDECIAQQIDTYPTWVFEGKKYSGEKSLSELAEIIGFSDK